MTQTRQNFTLSDGRNLEYLTNGLKSEAAIILHAGTTQDIAGWQTWLDYFASKGIFALSFGRSGYAGSTKQPGRITIDVAKDIAELSQHLGITKFVNLGLSGGGQHAIATGLDPRSVGVVTVGSLAPFAELGERFYDGMKQAGNVADSVTGAELSERDQLAASKPTWKVVLDSCAFTMGKGWDWVADDYSSYLQPWGFDPRDVKVPTVIWQAELDENVPVQHGKWLSENMPNTRFEIRAGESHLGLYVNYEEEIMQSAIALLTSS
jgi:pimeloyl-ACP methyl ester carboxylesterase